MNTLGQRGAVLGLIFAASLFAQSRRWTEAAAKEWYGKQPWLVGSNYIPATAINQLEMWQAATFDPDRIDLELGWAEGLGMNTMRVFLHDLLWQQDAAGFKTRMNTFLAIAAKHHIRPLFVLFDSVWDPNPQLGTQRAPRPGVHNSGWLQSPGAAALRDRNQYPRLEAYVKGVTGAFANDNRVLGWDVWNEPDNQNSGSYQKSEVSHKSAYVRTLLPKVFQWAREAGVTQPLTSGLWHNHALRKLSAIEKIQVESSDVISFHDYGSPEEFKRWVVALESFRRPILCTEYMARPRDSTFQGTLPVAKEFHVAAINWGFVAGKTQTVLPWDSWKNPYIDHQPPVWFHDIFYFDGRPYRPEEVEFIRKITARQTAAGR